MTTSNHTFKLLEEIPRTNWGIHTRPGIGVRP